MDLFKMNDSVEIFESGSNVSLDDYCNALGDLFEWAIEGVLIFVVGNIGLLGNCISIWTFSRQRVHRIFHNLLLVLALFDIVYVACSIHLFALAKFWPAYDQLARVPSLPIVIPIAQIGLMGSVYCTVALALERFLAVCYPFLPRRHVYSTKSFVIPVILFSFLYNVPKFFELTLEEVEVNTNMTNCFGEPLVFEPNATTLALRPTDLRVNPLYIRIYILWMNLFFHIVGPFVVLIILNYKVHTRIKEFEKTLTDTLRVCFNRTTSQRVTSGLGHVDEDGIDEDLLRDGSGRNTFIPRRFLSARCNSEPRNGSHGHRGRHESGVDETTSFMADGNGTTLSNISGISGLNNISGSTNDPNEIRRASLRYWNDDNQDDGSTGRRGKMEQRKQERQNAWSTPRKREVLLSRISIYIVFMFVSCHSVRLIPNTFEVIHTYSSDYEGTQLPWPTWVARITNISHVLLTLVCSSNFYIYYFKHGSLCQRATSKQSQIRGGSATGKRSVILTNMTEINTSTRNLRTSFQTNRPRSARSSQKTSYQMSLADTLS